ncbi:putative holin-like toxin [Streptococcus suis]
MSVAEAFGLMFQFSTLLIVLLTFIFNNRKKLKTANRYETLTE